MTKEITTWEEGCRSAAAKVLNEYGRGYDGYVNPLVGMRWYTDEGMRENGWYLPAACYALVGAVHVGCYDSGKAAIDHICDTLIKKQHDYGHGNITRFGLQGIVVRLSDKVARLENLTKRDAEAAARNVDVPEGTQALNESILDTWEDVVGYCVIALMVIDGTFELELEADQPKPKKDGLQPRARYVITDQHDVYVEVDGEWEYRGVGHIFYEDVMAVNR